MRVFEPLVKDWRQVTGLLRAVDRIGKMDATSTRLIPDIIGDVARKYPANIAFIFEGREITYAQFDAMANRFAHWARSAKIYKGDTVALLMNNRPEYVAFWLGLTRAGVVTALLNNSLTGQALVHCVNVADARHLVVDADLATTAREVAGQFARPVSHWSICGLVEGMESLDAALPKLPDTPPPPAWRDGVTGASLAVKIFTSGTTGLPKAAKITHIRLNYYMHVLTGAVDAKVSDRTLLVLPLYHSTGGLCGVGCALTTGGTLILERKFSASRFWDVAVDQRATLFIYVGELCRFLTAAPPHPREGAHSLRAVIGNGLRPDVWERFVARFKIPWVIEFYGSTEGNVAISNLENTVGSVGRIPHFLRGRFNVQIVRFDLEKEQPIRGPDGLCQPAAPDEIGEVIGEIRTDDPRFRFEGYAGDEEQTKRKILRDVFRPGDAWFRTGDLMRQDNRGAFYFVDRIGDTYRWKSENVSTGEVAEALGVFPGVVAANVYGVEAPGQDGKAGMANLVVEDGFDLNALRAHLARELPPYARPVFLRLSTREEAAARTTGTFKFKKLDLVREGFDPARVSDPMYVDDPSEGAYRPIDAQTFRAIAEGKLRL